jgi:hypothetical protein
MKIYNAKKAIRTSTVRYSGLDQLEVPGLGLPTRTRESIVLQSVQRFQVKSIAIIVGTAR